MAVRTENIAHQLGSDAVGKLIIKMAVPSMISILIQSLYSLVNSIYLAYFNEDALTVISCGYPVQLCMSALAIGTGVALTTLIAMNFGSDDKNKVGKIVIHGIYIAVAYWILFAVFGSNLGVYLVTTNVSQPEIVANIKLYVSVITVCSLSLFVKTILDRILLGSGRVIVTMISQIIGIAVNIILDPFLIFGIGFFPQLGVKGAALGTVIGQTVAAVFTIAVFLYHKKEYFITKSSFSLSFSVLRDIYKIAAPYIIMQAMGSVLMACINIVLGSFSNAAINVMSICYRLQNFVYLPVFGISSGVVPVFAYNYGKRNKTNLVKAVWISVIMSIFVMTVGVYVFCRYPHLCINMFNPTREMMRIAISALRILSVSYVLSAISVIMTTVFYTVNRGSFAFTVSLVRQILIKIPLAFIFARYGLIYVWFAFPVAEFVGMVVTLIFYAIVYQKKIRYLDKQP